MEGLPKQGYSAREKEHRRKEELGGYNRAHGTDTYARINSFFLAPYSGSLDGSLAIFAHSRTNGVRGTGMIDTRRNKERLDKRFVALENSAAFVQQCQVSRTFFLLLVRSQSRTTTS